MNEKMKSVLFVVWNTGGVFFIGRKRRGEQSTVSRHRHDLTGHRYRLAK